MEVKLQILTKSPRSTHTLSCIVDAHQFPHTCANFQCDMHASWVWHNLKHSGHTYRRRCECVLAIFFCCLINWTRFQWCDWTQQICVYMFNLNIYNTAQKVYVYVKREEITLKNRMKFKSNRLDHKKINKWINETAKKWL